MNLLLLLAVSRFFPHHFVAILLRFCVSVLLVRNQGRTVIYTCTFVYSFYILNRLSVYRCLSVVHMCKRTSVALWVCYATYFIGTTIFIAYIVSIVTATITTKITQKLTTISQPVVWHKQRWHLKKSCQQSKQKFKQKITHQKRTTHIKHGMCVQRIRISLETIMMMTSFAYNITHAVAVISFQFQWISIDIPCLILPIINIGRIAPLKWIIPFCSDSNSMQLSQWSQLLILDFWHSFPTRASLFHWNSAIDSNNWHFTYSFPQ